MTFNLNEWSKTWLVTFNSIKTDVLFISNIKKNNDIELLFDNSVLTFSDNHRHLGVTLSANAKWGDHVENICNCASKRINILRQ